MPGSPRRPLVIALSLIAVAGIAAAVVSSWRPPPVVPIPVTPLQVRETWRTTASHGETDSLAVYRGDANDPAWLFATDKHGNRIQVFDASTGKYLRDVGTSGGGRGEFLRPNGICVARPAEDLALLLVVERDNHRLTAWRLPELNPAEAWPLEAESLSKPYGIVVAGNGDAYVTDNSRDAGARVRRIPLGQADKRSKSGAFVERGFGERSGPGLLRFVESIAADPIYRRLYICDESPWSRNVKVYSDEGKFLGQTFGEGYILDEPEGIALWPEGEGGWIILTNQAKELSTFHFFDRRTLRHVGCFVGNPRIANTDGIAVTQGTLGELAGGAIYAVDNDGPVAAYAWRDVAAALQLDSQFPRDESAAPASSREADRDPSSPRRDPLRDVLPARGDPEDLLMKKGQDHPPDLIDRPIGR